MIRKFKLTQRFYSREKKRHNLNCRECNEELNLNQMVVSKSKGGKNPNTYYYDLACARSKNLIE